MWCPTHARLPRARQKVFFSSAPHASTGCGTPPGSVRPPGTYPRERWQARHYLSLASQYLGACEGLFDALTDYLPKRGTAGDPACRGAVDVARKLTPLVHGEVAALTMATTPLRLPDLAFEDANGKPKKLSDWRGRTVLLMNSIAACCSNLKRSRILLLVSIRIPSRSGSSDSAVNCWMT